MLKGVITNAASLATLFERRRAALSAASRRGVRRALLAIDTEASKRLSGSGSAGAYPIPVRTGTLRRAQGVRLISDTSGLVFNRAIYARSVHDGFRAYRNPKAPFHFARPFITDAIEAAKPTDIVRAELRRAVFE